MLSVLPSLLQPPPTAEELALKEQVTQVLSSQGVLAKLKAELRAAVFEVMHEREGFVKTSNSMAPKLSDFPVETRTTALWLIVECLQFFHWDHSLRVLRAEANAQDEKHDTALLAKKLGLRNYSSSSLPALFQLIEARELGGDQAAVSNRPVGTVQYAQFDDEEDDEEQTQRGDTPAPTITSWERGGGQPALSNIPAGTVQHNQFDQEGDDKEESQGDDTPAPKLTSWEQEDPPRSSLLREPERAEKEVQEGTDESKDEEAESSAEIEESMAEEVPSGSELEESNYTNYEEEESHDRSAASNSQPTTLYPRQLREESQPDESQEVDKPAHQSDDEEAVSMAAPPPAPAKLPSLPPLVCIPRNTLAGDADDDFDAEEEAERLRKLDAALQAMEAEDDTGTLQQLKASLKMELQEQDSFVSSGGLGREGESSDEEKDGEATAGTSKHGNGDEQDDEGYGSSDFEEEEDIASEISEEMESMSELSDKEDESEDGAVVSATEAEPPRALRNDTRVESEGALNSYDYIEDVEKSEW